MPDNAGAQADAVFQHGQKRDHPSQLTSHKPAEKSCTATIWDTENLK